MQNGRAEGPLHPAEPYEGEEYIIVLASGTVLRVEECPLPLWEDSEGQQHYLRAVWATDGTSRRFCFIERPFTEFEALARTSVYARRPED